MRKRLSWWGTIKLFLLLITFALFIYIVFNVPSSLVLFNKLFLAVGLNILAAVLELLKVVKDEPQVLMWLPLFFWPRKIKEIVVWHEYPKFIPSETGHYNIFSSGEVYEGAWWSNSKRMFLWHSDEGFAKIEGEITHWAESLKGPKLT